MYFQFVASIVLLSCLSMASSTNLIHNFNSKIPDHRGFDFPYLLMNVSLEMGHRFMVMGGKTRTKRFQHTMTWRQRTIDPPDQVLKVGVLMESVQDKPVVDNCTPLPFKQLVVALKVRNVLSLTTRHLQRAELCQLPSDTEGRHEFKLIGHSDGLPRPIDVVSIVINDLGN